jgi:outer membrane protein TolC
MLEHQIMVGLSFNLPVQRSRRRAAEQMAEAKVLRTSADAQQMRDQIRLDVEKALRRIGEADKTLALYRNRAVPAAKRRVIAIQAGLDVDRTSFIETIRAERELRTMELRLYSAFADAYRHRADLAWAIGSLPGMSGKGDDK